MHKHELKQYTQAQIILNSVQLSILISEELTSESDFVTWGLGGGLCGM